MLFFGQQSAPRSFVSITAQSQKGILTVYTGHV
jgi:hypothetical protein